MTHQPQPARALLRRDLLRTKRTHCPLQHRRRDRWPVCDQERQPIEQQIPGGRRLWRTGAVEDRLGHLEGASSAREASGEQRSGQRVEVGGARELGVERFELAGGTQQERGGVASTPGGERDLTAQELYTSPLEGVELADVSCSEA